MLSPIRVIAAAMLLTLVISPSAQAQDIDPEFRADIEKVLDVTGVSSTGTQMATLITSQIIDGMRQQQLQVPDRAIQLVKDVLNVEFVRAFEAPDGLRNDLVRIYASHFTHDEIKGLMAFYTTDVGRKAAALIPQLSQEGAVAGQKWAQANTPRVLEVLQKRLHAEGFIP